MSSVPAIYISGRVLLHVSDDPDGLASLCVRPWLAQNPEARSDNSLYPELRHALTFCAEPGKGKGVGVRALTDIPAGTHIGWVEGLVTRRPPTIVGEAFSFQLSHEPPVFVDAMQGGSLATFINEDLVNPNCESITGVYGNKLRIRIVTIRRVDAGAVLSLSYRGSSVPSEMVLAEETKHHWGKSLAPDGTLSHNTRACANRRYHASGPIPLTSMLCVECTAFYGGHAIPFCSDACFRSHVADWASADTADRTFCAPRRAHYAKPLLTRAVTPRAAARR
jgi:hypothetical protein